MKKVLASRVLALVVAICLAISASAQTSSGNAAIFDKTTLIASVKASADADKLTLNNLAVENKWVFKSFTRDFQHATEIGVNSNDDFVFIYCVVDGNANRIMYTRGGKIERIIRTYRENSLDPGVRNLVKTHYPGFSIFVVTEVFEKGKTAYFVTIENERMWKIIRVVHGEMDLYREFTKS